MRMTSDEASTSAFTEQLCLACGLCCNGVLFKDVELQANDDGAKLAALGLPLSQPGRPRAVKTLQPIRFPQPCAALDINCRCRIYSDRPRRCREFECAVFKAVEAGKLESKAALRTIRTALQRADRVRQLLRELGDREETLALSLRFKRMRRRLELGTADEDTAETYSRLTLAVHDLNLLLRAQFYPGACDQAGTLT